MPALTNTDRVRSLLDRDRAWAAYAIGDLSPEHARHCAWHVSDDESAALVLLYRGFTPPILFAMGDSASLSAAVAELAEPEISLHVQADGLAALAPTYTATSTRPIWRMALTPSSFRADSIAEVTTLDASDLSAVTELYEDGWAHGDGPTFFQQSMLEQGTFRGVREGSAVIAVAGTHLFSSPLGVCTIGNVYTRRDRRRRGLGARVTTAVAQHALANGISTIVLNVAQDNLAARRVYERLGFHRHCEFFEGEARLTKLPRDGSRDGAS